MVEPLELVHRHAAVGQAEAGEERVSARKLPCAATCCAVGASEGLRRRSRRRRRRPPQRLRVAARERVDLRQGLGQSRPGDPTMWSQVAHAPAGSAPVSTESAADGVTVTGRSRRTQERRSACSSPSAR